MLNGSLQKWALDTFMRLASIDCTSGEEQEVSNAICKLFENYELPYKSYGFDVAHEHFAQHGVQGQRGNMFVYIPATLGCEQLPVIGFNAHIDRVQPGKGIKPSLTADGTRIVSDGTTILAADDLSGVSVILTMLKALNDQAVPHGPLQIIFTVCEETKLLGARYLEPSLLRCSRIYSFDGEGPGDIVLGSCASDKITIKITGKNAHAGVHPEQGISAPVIASLAIANLHRQGLLGRKEVCGQHMTSANLNIVAAQKVGTNSVQAEVCIEGEARAYDEDLLQTIADTIEHVFAQSAKSVKSSDGTCGQVEFKADRGYNRFQLSPSDDIVRSVINAMGKVNISPVIVERVMGGMDACWLNKHVPTVVLGGGAHNYHRVDEYLDVAEFFQACELAIQLARAE